MPARKLEIAVLGNLRDLETQLIRAGVVAEDSGKRIQGSAKASGEAAMAQAKAMGASAEVQEHAAARAAVAYTEMAAKITRSQKAAGDAAASAARATGAAVDEQRAAYTRAIATQAEYEAATKKAAQAEVDAAAKSSKARADAAAHSKKFGESVAGAGKWAAAGLIGAGVEATRLGMKFQTSTATIAANAGITQAAADKIGKAFLDTAGHSIFSGQQMSEAFASVAGQLKVTEGHALSAAEALKVESAAGNLAEATHQSLAVTTAALAQTMQSYHLSVNQAAGASDVLFNVSKALNMPVDGIANALLKLHARLGEVAPSLRDTSTLLLALGERGQTGTRGVLLANTALTTLLGGGKNVTQVLKALGVSVYDQNGKFIGLQSVIAQLQPKLAGMTEQQRLFAEKTLFGAGAAKLMGSVIQGGIPAWTQTAAATTKAGTAQQAAHLQSKTLHDQLETLKATVLDLGTKFGLFLIPKLEATGQAISSVISWFGKHKAAAEALAITIGSVLGLAITVFAYTKAVAFVGATRDMIGGMGRLAGGISDAVGSISTKLATLVTGSEATAVKVGVSDAEMETSNAAAGASFGQLALDVEGAGLKIGTSMEGAATAVAAADGAIETANVGLIASFGATLTALSPLLVALGAYEAFTTAGGQLTNTTARDTSTFSGAGSTQGLTKGEKHSLSYLPKYQQNQYSQLTAAGVGPKSAFSDVSYENYGSAGGGSQAHPYSGGSTHDQKAIVYAAAKAYGIDPAFLWGIYGAETSFGSNLSTSPTGAQGYMQFEPGTAKQYNVNPYNFMSSIYGAANMLSKSKGGGPMGMVKSYYGAASSTYLANVENYAKQYGYSPPGGAASGAGGGAAAPTGSGSGNAAVQKLLDAAGAGKTKTAAQKAVRTLLYADPLHGDQYNVERTDQGKDYGSIKGNIGAIGAGVITLAQNLQGFGQTIVEKLTGGPNKGQSIYYGLETGATGVGLHTGQTVGAGQTVARGLGTGGVEFGYWDPATGRSKGAPFFNGSGATPPGTQFASWMAQLQRSGGTYTTTKGGITTGGGQNTAYALQQAIQTFITNLNKAANALIATYTGLEQSGTIKTLSKALGFSTGGVYSSSTSTRWVPDPHQDPRKDQHLHQVTTTTSESVGAALQKVIEGIDSGSVLKDLIAGKNPSQIDALTGGPDKAGFAATLTAQLGQIHGKALSQLDSLLGEKHGTALNKLVADLSGLHGKALTKIETKLTDSHSKPMKQLGADLTKGPGTLPSITSIVTKSEAASPQGKAFNSLVASLLAAGQKSEAAALVAAHKGVMATLAQELYAAQVLKDGESLQLEATQLKGLTQLAATTAAKELAINKDSFQIIVDQMTAAATQLKDGNQIIVDQMSAAATQIKDHTQLISDQFAAMAQAVQDATQLMADSSSAIVTRIQDQTAIRVDILGERGLYGLNLIAQQEQVQLDQMKAGFDAQIAQDQAQLDVTKAMWNTNIAQAQTAVAQVTINEDQLVAFNQQTADTVQLGGDVQIAAAQQVADTAQLGADIKVASAQQHVDSVTMAQDIAMQLAQTAVDLSATAPQAQHDVAAAQLRKTQGTAYVAEGVASAGLTQAQSDAASVTALAQAGLTMAQTQAAGANATAQAALAQAQGQAAITEAAAQQALANAQGQGSAAIALAQQNLTSAQDTAAQQEAAAQARIDITKGQAATQFAGSGLVVNMYGIPMENGAAITPAMDWFARTSLNVPV